MTGRPEQLFPLFSELETLKGVGPKTAKLLVQAGVETPRDIAFSLPYAVIDRRRRTSIQGVELPATLTVEVTPVAEEIGAVPGVGDSDGDGLADLSMNGDYVYTASQRGSEDTWFALNQAGFDLSAGWANQDADEIGVANDNTYARLEPVVTVGDTSDANGAQFRWTDSGGAVQTATYAGTPIDIPVSALATVEFLPAPDFSGQMEIIVTAYTEDFDDDNEGTGTPDTAESGMAVLSNLVIVPVADDVALTLTARVSGREDTLVPLQIRPRSSDDTETFNITINDIPDGALVYYDGNPTPLVVTGGSVTITDFDRTADLNILPPPDSNDDFTLSIEAVSVDTVTIDGTIFTDVSTPPTVLPLVVQVRGVADDANISVTPQTYVESALDAGATIALNTLVSASLQDTDSGDLGGPSETLTMRVSGLPDGFSLSEGALLSPPSVTGTDRVWALDTDQFALAEINVPDNVSGLVEFNVAAVTTENDGDSQTGPTMLASFTVTPSPEATTTTSAVLVEDEVTSLNFAIVHENGDTDETITGARVRVADAVTGDYTLYLGTNPGAVLLADAGLTVFNDGTDDFYELSAAQAAELSALPAPHVDGDLGTVEIFYEITDQEFANDQPSGTGAISIPAVASAYQSVDFALSATAVTDQPDVSITAITSVAASTVITDTIVGDDASPDNVVLNEQSVQRPINAYGASKRAVEDILRDFERRYGLRHVIFRYFNVAGADPDAEVGEFHQPETHLIPLMLDAIDGKRDALTIYGTDYPTPDGTCIRDYVHVCDLVDAHVLGLKWLLDGRDSDVFNLGTGDGFSVRAVVEQSRAVTNRAVPIVEGARRAGDLARHQGHHRPGHRARLVLRFRPRRALHAGGSRPDRGQDEGHHQRPRAGHHRDLGARPRPRLL